MPPLVSVIIPVGPRHTEHARLAAASVAWQTAAHLCEVVISCDGGANVPPLPGCTILESDGTRHGPAHTRNRALAAARGHFILPLDADDYLLPRAVEHLLREYSTGKHGYVYGDCYTVERNGQYMLRSAPNYTQKTYHDGTQQVGGMDAYNLHVVTALTPRKHWLAVGGWDEGVDAWEDWTGNLRLAIAGVCGYRLPYPIFTYRVYEGDRMTRFYGGAPEYMERVWERYRNANGDIPMASCCGGDSALAGLAASALLGIEQGPAAPMAGNLVRVEYIGDERGTSTYAPYPGRQIKLGQNAVNKYADVSNEEAAWLQDKGVPIRVLPVFDDPGPPDPLRPIVTAEDVLTDSAVKPRRGRPPTVFRPGAQ